MTLRCFLQSLLQKKNESGVIFVFMKLMLL
ncbi:hypothetical protein EMIT048CA2_110043 [Pseudomonas chlororaphis]